MDAIVSTQWLAERLGDPNLAVVDLRWRHGRPRAGLDAYETTHLPGAVFLDLDRDLSDRSDPALMRGRHPLPEAGRFVRALAGVGIGRNTTVIVYDDAAGSVAARLWFLLRWVGHGEAAVLDGGITKWVAEGRPTETGAPAVGPVHSDPIEPRANASMIVPTKSGVRDALARGTVLLDARTPERFRGAHEPIDKHAGRIAGAINAPFTENLVGTEVKTFRPPHELRAHYERLGITAGSDVACYCGSGVTACHDVLAMTLAGFPMPRLYPGSWSEWSLDPAMPMATG